MIDWWGPVIYEYYAGSEGNGFCQLNSEEWLAHKGSVGTALTGILHICDEEGEEVPIGESGSIFFEQPEKPPVLNIIMTRKKRLRAAIRCIKTGPLWVMSASLMKMAISILQTARPS
jgi:acyl-coenzyme A synthetase/AMP-(fatty) acid ligase